MADFCLEVHKRTLYGYYSAGAASNKGIFDRAVRYQHQLGIDLGSFPDLVRFRSSYAGAFPSRSAQKISLLSLVMMVQLRSTAAPLCVCYRLKVLRLSLQNQIQIG